MTGFLSLCWEFKVEYSSPILDYEHWAQSWSRFLGSQPAAAGNIRHKPGGRLPLLSTRPAVTFPAKEITPSWPVPNYTAWRQRHTGVRSLPNDAQPGLEPMTCKSQVRHPANSATGFRRNECWIMCNIFAKMCWSELLCSRMLWLVLTFSRWKFLTWIRSVYPLEGAFVADSAVASRLILCQCIYLCMFVCKIYLCG